MSTENEKKVVTKTTITQKEEIKNEKPGNEYDDDLEDEEDDEEAADEAEESEEVRFRENLDTEFPFLAEKGKKTYKIFIATGSRAKT